MEVIVIVWDITVRDSDRAVWYSWLHGGDETTLPVGCAIKYTFAASDIRVSLALHERIYELVDQKTARGMAELTRDAYRGWSNNDG